MPMFVISSSTTDRSAVPAKRGSFVFGFFLGYSSASGTLSQEYMTFSSSGF